jgi:hypothetical protein
MVKLPTSLLRQTITVEPYLGSSATGPRFGAPVAIRARVEGRRQVVKSADGHDIVSSAAAIIRPEHAIAAQSRVTYDGRKYDVVDVRPGQGLTRPTHFELVLA